MKVSRKSLTSYFPNSLVSNMDIESEQRSAQGEGVHRDGKPGVGKRSPASGVVEWVDRLIC